MFTTRNMRISALCSLLLSTVLMLLFAAGNSVAQCTLNQNSYLFLHPYFNGENWIAAAFESDLFPVEPMCSNKPLQISFQRDLSGDVSVVYTTVDHKWMLTNAPLVDNSCICCRPTIEYTEPQQISILQELALQTDLPFHVLTRQNAAKDTVLLLVAGEDAFIYSLHVSTSSGTVGAIDSFNINPSGTQKISGIWGEPDNNGIDTAVWIAGSDGLIRLLPYTGGKWGTMLPVSINNSETVTAIGDGYAGCSSGIIYRRAGLSYIKENGEASSPIRMINRKIAVGDGGAVLVRQESGWKSFSLGNSNYRCANLTSDSTGTAVELLDEQWNYSMKQLYDTQTTISAIQPSEAEVGLNGGIYEYYENGVVTITLNLSDPDNNRSMPQPEIHSSNGNTLSFDGPQILRHNSAAICTTAQAYFTDTLVNFILSNDRVTMEANGKRVRYDISCGLWKWQQFKYESVQGWQQNDTLVVITGRDTLKILNNNTGAVKIKQPGLSPVRPVWSFSMTSRRLRVTTEAGSMLRGLEVIDISGRLVWKRRLEAQSKESVISPPMPSGILILRMLYTNGKIEVRTVTSRH